MARPTSRSPPIALPVSLAAWTGYFLRLGTLGFGGPIALTVAMQRDLVEEWAGGASGHRLWSLVP